VNGHLAIAVVIVVGGISVLLPPLNRFLEQELSKSAKTKALRQCEALIRARPHRQSSIAKLTRPTEQLDGEDVVFTWKLGELQTYSSSGKLNDRSATCRVNLKTGQIDYFGID
jgi:hypothetical protein